MEHSSKKSNKYILTCPCPGMPAFATDAYGILFPNDTVPTIYSGSSNLFDLADKNSNTNFGEYVKAMASSMEQFAYYVEENDGKIVDLWDLKKGVKVAC